MFLDGEVLSGHISKLKGGKIRDLRQRVELDRSMV